MRIDKPITVLARDLGDRVAAFRLSRNIRQEDIAREAGISRGAVARIEAGGGTIDSLLRVLKALGIEDRVEMLVPEARMSPLDPKSDNAPRLRARPPTDASSDDTPWSWALLLTVSLAAIPPPWPPPPSRTTARPCSL